MYLTVFVEVLVWSLFCNALLCVLSSFAIILTRKRKLSALVKLSYRCLVTVSNLELFLVIPQFSLLCVIVVLSDHTHLLFNSGTYFNKLQLYAYFEIVQN